MSQNHQGMLDIARKQTPTEWIDRACEKCGKVVKIRLKRSKWDRSKFFCNSCDAGKKISPFSKGKTEIRRFDAPKYGACGNPKCAAIRSQKPGRAKPGDELCKPCDTALTAHSKRDEKTDVYHY